MEYMLQDTDFLVSQTDAKGNILFANEDFCKIAGYTLEELIGKPHSIVRHPDMPKAAFKDLWDTAKSGKVWKGYVKNKTKNGGYYWVSSTDNPEISAMFLTRGSNDFINKPFSKEEFSCHLNNAIESLENIETITNYASRDFLTGLYNRRYFFNTMKPYFSDAVASGEEFVVAMIDIDNFKKINDTYGHDIGDKAIIHLSEILRSGVQHQDVIARFGGEEFCIVLKGITREKASEVLERIRKNVSLSPLIISKDDEIFFTVSIGATLEHEDTLIDSINEAAAKLYQAKTTTERNKLVV